MLVYQRIPGGFPNITCWAISTASGPSTFGYGEPFRDGGLGEGPEEGACWDGAFLVEFWGKPWENHGKILKMTLNMMKIWGKTMRKQCKTPPSLMVNQCESSIFRPWREGTTTDFQMNKGGSQGLCWGNDHLQNHSTSNQGGDTDLAFNNGRLLMIQFLMGTNWDHPLEQLFLGEIPMSVVVWLISHCILFKTIDDQEWMVLYSKLFTWCIFW